MINSVFKEDIATILNESLDWNIFKNKTVMVTGANGFIPFYIAATFLELKNVKVIAVVRNEEKYSDTLIKIEKMNCSLKNFLFFSILLSV